MALDRDRLKEVAEKLGYGIEFNSDKSSIVLTDGEVVKYDDISLDKGMTINFNNGSQIKNIPTNSKILRGSGSKWFHIQE